MQNTDIKYFAFKKSCLKQRKKYTVKKMAFTCDSMAWMRKVWLYVQSLFKANPKKADQS